MMHPPSELLDKFKGHQCNTYAIPGVPSSRISPTTLTRPFWALGLMCCQSRSNRARLHCPCATIYSIKTRHGTPPDASHAVNTAQSASCVAVHLDCQATKRDLLVGGQWGPDESYPLPTGLDQANKHQQKTNIQRRNNPFGVRDGKEWWQMTLVSKPNWVHDAWTSPLQNWSHPNSLRSSCGRKG